MALTSYTTLKNEIESYLNRTDLTANLDTFIDLAESRMARDLRLREMETIDTSITTVSALFLRPTGPSFTNIIYLNHFSFLELSFH